MSHLPEEIQVEYRSEIAQVQGLSPKNRVHLLRMRENVFEKNIPETSLFGC